MSSFAAPETPSVTVSPWETWGIWARHLACFVLPLTSLVFVTTGPHAAWAAPLFLLPLVASMFADYYSGPERRAPSPALPAVPFNAVLYMLVALQVMNVVLFARLIGQAGLFSMDAWAGIILVGINSGYSGIVVAHELVHRASPLQRNLGRLLLVTVLYEHFATEHVRGHHARIGTEEDPATARFDETWWRFFARTVPGQFRSAWQLEERRLDARGLRGLRRLASHQVLQGIVAETGLAAGLGLVFGPGALLAHVAQAAHAVMALEAVNYFEHWGLTRRSRRVTPVDSWDTESRFTLYTLVGLSRHADHHAYASRPYQQLRHWEESPKLPYGYFVMVSLVIARNTLARRMLKKELRRKGLGPYGEPAVA
jgi:alkane 1-monooxygenase